MNHDKKVVEIKSSFSYNIIYVFTIHDGAHDNRYKIGQTSVRSFETPTQEEVEKAARERINS